MGSFQVCSLEMVTRNSGKLFKSHFNPKMDPVSLQVRTAFVFHVIQQLLIEIEANSGTTC